MNESPATTNRPLLFGDTYYHYPEEQLSGGGVLRALAAQDPFERLLFLMRIGTTYKRRIADKIRRRLPLSRRDCFSPDILDVMRTLDNE